MIINEGKANGKGYYVYERGMKPKPDPSLQPIIEKSRKLANVMHGGKVLILSSSNLTDSRIY